MDLQELLKEEEKTEGCKMGYVMGCYRSGDQYWNKDFIDPRMNTPDHPEGMIKDLINEGGLSDEQLTDLIEDKYLITQSCCDTYYAVEVY
mgnify:CR=1 FL=1|tara:strand:+ start:5801 stop:6070 length:270 start_codon:yes stop_codon:yes gene_type:complete